MHRHDLAAGMVSRGVLHDMCFDCRGVGLTWMYQRTRSPAWKALEGIEAVY